MSGHVWYKSITIGTGENKSSSFPTHSQYTVMTVRKHPRYQKIFYLNSKFNFSEKLSKLILRCKLVHCVIPRQLKLQLSNIKLKNIFKIKIGIGKKTFDEELFFSFLTVTPGWSGSKYKNKIWNFPFFSTLNFKERRKVVVLIRRSPNYPPESKLENSLLMNFIINFYIPFRCFHR